ncbi:pyridoxal-phosphate dependent enzyme [Candidatus Bathyarchaeota archaeon]|nr:pyridoxal-phosphate dependent enzyme [Candidatus Bathyarchaeota archaeon]
MFTEEFKKYGIGSTVFTRSINIEKLLGINKLYLKFEAGNPTGSMKDRAAYATLNNASEKGFDTLVVASCGNFGASIVHLSKTFSLTPHVYIPEKYQTPRISEIERQGGIIHRAPGTYEELVEISSNEAEDNGWYNGNPGTPDNTEISLLAYETIAYEIFDDLKYAPDALSVAVSNGTCFSGIYQGWKKLHNRGRTDKIPAMVCASTSGGNPIVTSYNKGKKKIVELDPEAIDETPSNEPIVNWKSLDGQIALDALWDSGGYAVGIEDSMLEIFSEILERQEGFSVLPASASALAAMIEYSKEKATPKEDDFVVVLTSRKY